jgi:hypothetical protein
MANSRCYALREAKTSKGFLVNSTIHLSSQNWNISPNRMSRVAATTYGSISHRKVLRKLCAAVLALGLCATTTAAPPKDFVQKDVDAAGVLFGLPWTASRDEISAKWTAVGLKIVEDSKFDLSYQGTVTVGGTQIPKVLVSYMYTPEGKLKEIYIVSSAPSHAAWRKAAFAGMGIALVESTKDNWPGSKGYYHRYWWPLKRYTVLMEYETISPDPTTPYDSENSHLGIKIVGTAMSEADMSSSALANTFPRDN